MVGYKPYPGIARSTLGRPLRGSRQSRTLPVAYLLILCAFLFAGSIAFAAHCWIAIHSPEELDYGEGIVMWQAEHIVHLTEAFHRIDVYPYVVFHYTPLYHLVSHGVAALTHNLLAAGRWVSFIATILIGVLIGLFTWFSIQTVPVSNRATAALVAGMLCYNLSTIRWAQLMRVDMLALLFTFSGLFLFLLADRHRSFDYVAFLFFVFALFTKQTQLAGPAACLVIAFVINRTRAMKLLVFSVLLGCAGLAMLAVPTHGAALLNLFVYNQNPFSVLNMLGIVQDNLASMSPLAAITLAIPILSGLRLARLPRHRAAAHVRHWLKKNRTRRAVGIYAVYILFAFAVSLTCGKRGSSYNYFLEWNLAGCFPVALALVYILRQWMPRRSPIAQTAVLLLFLLFCSNGVAALAQVMRRSPATSNPQDAVKTLDVIQHLPGAVYSENMTLLMYAHKEIPAEPSIITNLAQNGYWNEADFIHRIETNSFSAIVVTTSLDNRNRYTETVQAAIERSYRLRYTFGLFKIYFPQT
jgi:hypothetical protein